MTEVQQALDEVQAQGLVRHDGGSGGKCGKGSEAVDARNNFNAKDINAFTGGSNRKPGGRGHGKITSTVSSRAK